jgi:Fic-DOC domain mobile mystery protein B
MGALGAEPEGATPLTEDDLKGLKIDWVRNRGDLDIVESQGVGLARRIYLGRKNELSELLDDYFIRQLHQTMFQDVWTWAGKYRTKDLNIGVDFQVVAMEVRNMVSDAEYWLKVENDLDMDLAIVKIHHRLVQIHPFNNGNGRLGRVYVDLLARTVGRPPLNWRGNSEGYPDGFRSTYIKALIAADGGNLQPLLEFVRSEQAH